MVYTWIALNIYDVLSFWTHVERLNCIVGTQTCRSGCVGNRLSYDISWILTAPWQHDAIFVSFELGCVMRLLCRALLLIGSLPLSQTVIAESHIFRMPCRDCLSAVIIGATIAPVAHVAWIYRVPQLPSHNCVYCACYEGLLCCRSPDGRTRIDVRYARACTRVDYGGLFEPLKPHYLQPS
jgi:ribosomal protein S26